MSFNQYERPSSIADTEISIIAAGPLYGLLSALPRQKFNPSVPSTRPSVSAMMAVAQEIQRRMHDGVPYIVNGGGAWRKVGQLPNGSISDSADADKTEEWYGTRVTYEPLRLITEHSRIDLQWNSQALLAPEAEPPLGSYPIWDYSGNSVARAVSPVSGDLTVTYYTNGFYVSADSIRGGNNELIELDFIVDTANDGTVSLQADDRTDFIIKNEDGEKEGVSLTPVAAKPYISITKKSGQTTRVGSIVTYVIQVYQLKKDVRSLRLKVDHPAGLRPLPSKPTSDDTPSFKLRPEERDGKLIIAGIAGKKFTEGTLFRLRLTSSGSRSAMAGTTTWPDGMTVGTSVSRPGQPALSVDGVAIPPVFDYQSKSSGNDHLAHIVSRVTSGNALVSGEFEITVSLEDCRSEAQRFFLELTLPSGIKVSPDAVRGGSGMDVDNCVPYCNDDTLPYVAAFSFHVTEGGPADFVVNADSGAEFEAILVDRKDGSTVSTAVDGRISLTRIEQGRYLIVASSDKAPVTREAADSLFVVADGFRKTPLGRKNIRQEVFRLQFDGHEDIDSQGQIDVRNPARVKPAFPYVGTFRFSVDLIPLTEKIVQWAHPSNTAAGLPSYPQPYPEPYAFIADRALLPPFPFDSRYIALEIWRWFRLYLPALARLPFLSGTETALGPRTSLGEYRFDYDGGGADIQIVNADNGLRSFAFTTGLSTIGSIGSSAGSGTNLSPRFLDKTGNVIAFSDFVDGERVRAYELEFSTSATGNLRLVQLQKIGNNGMVDPGLIRDASARNLGWRQSFGNVRVDGPTSFSINMDTVRSFTYREPSTLMQFVIPAINNGYTIESPIGSPSSQIQPLVRNEINVSVPFDANTFGDGDSVLVYELSATSQNYSSPRVVLVRKLADGEGRDAALDTDAVLRQLEGRQYVGTLVSPNFNTGSFGLKVQKNSFVTTLAAYDSATSSSAVISHELIRIGDTVRLRHDGEKLIQVKYVGDAEPKYDTSDNTTDQQIFGKVIRKENVALPVSRRQSYVEINLSNPSSSDTEVIAWRIDDPAGGGMRATVDGVPAMLPANTQNAALVKTTLEWNFGAYVPEMPVVLWPSIVFFMKNGITERVRLVPSYDGTKVGDAAAPLPNWPSF